MSYEEPGPFTPQHSLLITRSRLVRRWWRLGAAATRPAGPGTSARAGSPSWGFRSLLQTIIGIAISLACVGLLARLISVQEVAASLGRGNVVVVVPAVGLYFLGSCVRSVRWRLLLGSYRVPTRVLFRTLIIGLMVNDVLPGRLGELARMALLARSARVPIGVSLASILVERVLDGLALTALLAIGIYLAGVGGWLAQLAGFSAVLFGAASAVLLLGAIAPAVAGRSASAITAPLPRRFRESLGRLTARTLEGLQPIRRPQVGLLVLGLSLLAWGVEASMYLVMALGFQVPGGVAVGALGAAVANLATLVPSSPGYVGTFDLALQAVLVGVFEAAPSDATAYALVVHAALLVPVVLLGALFLWRESLSVGAISRQLSAGGHAAGGEVEPR